MLQKVWIGCCGFPVSRKKYYKLFKLVELQNTFYNLPSLDWIKELRKELPPGFVLSIKAWQVISHPPQSPTWRKMKTKPPGNLDNYGLLKPSKENLDAWDKVLELARAGNAKFIIIQTPASMPFNSSSIQWVKMFFDKITQRTPSDILVGWEPRGAWSSEGTRHIEEIVKDYGIIHVTDILKRLPVESKVLYTRLHGLGKGEVNYRYKYTDNDLNKLIELINILKYKENYILFNNVYMFNDALRLKELINRRKYEVY